MIASPARLALSQTQAHRLIVRELEEFLRTRIRRVHFSDASVAPPLLAYVTHFPRLSITLAGCHSMEVAQRGRKQLIKPARGHAIFVPDHAWNPETERPAALGHGRGAVVCPQPAEQPSPDPRSYRCATRCWCPTSAS